jgi:hypothetical protein
MPVKYAGTTGYGELKKGEQAAGGGSAHAHVVGTGAGLRASIATDLGVADVPWAQRINIGFERDDGHRYIQPDADFACFGWMLKKGGIRKNWLERFL